MRKMCMIIYYTYNIGFHLLTCVRYYTKQLHISYTLQIQFLRLLMSVAAGAYPTETLFFFIFTIYLGPRDFTLALTISSPLVPFVPSLLFTALDWTPESPTQRWPPLRRNLSKCLKYVRKFIHFSFQIQLPV